MLKYSHYTFQRYMYVETPKNFNLENYFCFIFVVTIIYFNFFSCLFGMLNSLCKRYNLELSKLTKKPLKAFRRYKNNCQPTHHSHPVSFVRRSYKTQSVTRLRRILNSQLTGYQFYHRFNKCTHCIKLSY